MRSTVGDRSAQALGLARVTSAFDLIRRRGTSACVLRTSLLSNSATHTCLVPGRYALLARGSFGSATSLFLGHRNALRRCGIEALSRCRSRLLGLRTRNRLLLAPLPRNVSRLVCSTRNHRLITPGTTLPACALRVPRRARPLLLKLRARRGLHLASRLTLRGRRHLSPGACLSLGLSLRAILDVRLRPLLPRTRASSRRLGRRAPPLSPACAPYALRTRHSACALRTLRTWPALRSTRTLYALRARRTIAARGHVAPPDHHLHLGHLATLRLKPVNHTAHTPIKRHNPNHQQHNGNSQHDKPQRHQRNRGGKGLAHTRHPSGWSTDRPSSRPAG